MKKLIVFLLLSMAVIANTPTKSLMVTYTKTLGAGSSDTTTITGLVMDGDSVGIQIEISQDSISGNIRYQSITTNNYTDGTAFDAITRLDTINSNEKGVFTGPMQRVAGTDRTTVYVVTTNRKASIQTVTYYVYCVKWK